MDMNQDWKALSDDWQRQAVPGVDMDALRSEVKRRGRALRWIIGTEIGFTILVVAACLFILFQPEAQRFEQVLFGSLGVFLVAYQVFMIKLRLRDLGSAGLDVLAMLDLEIRRCRTTLSYWRIGMWTALAMWLVLYGFFLAGTLLDWGFDRTAGLGGGLAINVFVFPAMGVYGLWSCRRARARMARYLALREQLGAP